MGAAAESDDEWLDVDANDLIATPVNVNAAPSPDSQWIAEAENLPPAAPPMPSWPSIDEVQYDFAFEYEQQQQQQQQCTGAEGGDACTVPPPAAKQGKGFSYAAAIGKCVVVKEAPPPPPKATSYDAAFPPLVPLVQRKPCAPRPKRERNLPKWGQVAFAYE